MELLTHDETTEFFLGDDQRDMMPFGSSTDLFNRVFARYLRRTAKAIKQGDVKFSSCYEVGVFTRGISGLCSLAVTGTASSGEVKNAIIESQVGDYHDNKLNSLLSITCLMQAMKLAEEGAPTWNQIEAMRGRLHNDGEGATDEEAGTEANSESEADKADYQARITDTDSEPIYAVYVIEADGAQVLLHKGANFEVVAEYLRQCPDLDLVFRRLHYAEARHIQPEAAATA